MAVRRDGAPFLWAALFAFLVWLSKGLALLRRRQLGWKGQSWRMTVTPVSGLRPWDCACVGTELLRERHPL